AGPDVPDAIHHETLELAPAIRRAQVERRRGIFRAEHRARDFFARVDGDDAAVIWVYIGEQPVHHAELAGDFLVADRLEADHVVGPVGVIVNHLAARLQVAGESVALDREARERVLLDRLAVRAHFAP